MSETARNKTVFVFGGGGFIGSHLAELLIPDYRVIIFDKKNFSRRNIRLFESELEIIEGDFCNYLDWVDALEHVDFVLHFICSTLPAAANENCIYDIESNVVPTLQLLDALRNKKRTRLIFISSGGTVYGDAEQLPITETSLTNPICSYGIGKLMIEKYLHLYQHLYAVDYRTARLSNVYGERQSIASHQGLITTLLHRVVQGQPLQVWGDGSVVRDYLYVKDAVSGLRQLLSYRGPERIFNVSSNRGYSVNEVIEELRNVTGRKLKVAYSAARKFDVRGNVLSNALARRELAWKPAVSLHEGISRVYQWLIREGKE